MNTCSTALHPQTCRGVYHITRERINPIFLRVLSQNSNLLVSSHRGTKHLMSNTQQFGLVLKRDYLHLSRALMAGLGSYGSLYENTSARLMLRDVARSVARLPLNATQDLLYYEASTWRRRIAQVLPLPQALRKWMLPAARPQPKYIGRPAPEPMITPPATSGVRSRI